MVPGLSTVPVLHNLKSPNVRVLDGRGTTMAKTIPFNDLAVAKAVRELQKGRKEAQLQVVGVNGLHIVVKRSGTASYVVRYTVKGTGERRKTSIGRVGLKPLAEAKSDALAIMAAASRGKDTLQEAREAKKAQRSTLSVRQLFEQWQAKSTCSDQTLAGYRKVLEADAFPTIGDMPAADVDADLIVAILGPVEQRSKNVVHRLRSVLSSIYRFGMQRRLVQANPVAGLGFNHKSKSR